jgi:hypothetical protein
MNSSTMHSAAVSSAPGAWRTPRSRQEGHEPAHVAARVRCFDRRETGEARSLRGEPLRQLLRQIGCAGDAVGCREPTEPVGQPDRRADGLATMTLGDERGGEVLEVRRREPGAQALSASSLDDDVFQLPRRRVDGGGHSSGSIPTGAMGRTMRTVRRQRATCPGAGWDGALRISMLSGPAADRG